jgi:hypothetical protein
MEFTSSEVCFKFAVNGSCAKEYEDSGNTLVALSHLKWSVFVMAAILLVNELLQVIVMIR